VWGVPGEIIRHLEKNQSTTTQRFGFDLPVGVHPSSDLEVILDTEGSAKSLPIPIRGLNAHRRTMPKLLEMRERIKSIKLSVVFSL
jgi:hypothetical protein